MQVAIVMRKDHIDNPIQASINLVAQNRGYHVYDLSQRGETGDYDLVIVFHNKAVPVEGKRVVWWMCDLRPAYMFNEYEFDHVFVCNEEHLDEYADRYGEASYLPQCGDDREAPEAGRLIKDDLVFIGNMLSSYHRNRAPLLKELEQVGLKTKIITGERYTQDTKFIYKHAPFSLAISPPAKKYTSNRLYNILASGGFCLTLYFPGIETLFTKGTHLEWFKTAKEAKEIVEHYYQNPDEYEKVREQGHKLYLNNHTAAHRLDTILSKMDIV